MLVHECVLERMKHSIRAGEPFDRDDAAAFRLNRQHETAPDRLLVEQHGAGPAHAVLAAYVRAGQIEVVPEELSEGGARLDLPLAGAAVHGDADSVLHAGLRQRARAEVKVRSARTAATFRR